MIVSWMFACRQARSSSSSVASGLAMSRFARTVSWNSCVSCATNASTRRRSDVLRSRMSRPETLTTPRCGSQKRMSNRNVVDLPTPLGPVIAVTDPLGTVRLTPRSTGKASGVYANVTFCMLAPSNSTGFLPVTTGVAGAACSTASTRRPAARVLCSEPPSEARALTGPKDPTNVTNAMSAPATSTPPAEYAKHTIASIARSNTAMTTLVNACPPAWERWSFSSDFVRCCDLASRRSNKSRPRSY